MHATIAAEAPRMTRRKTPLSIEALLSWTYRDEMPKLSREGPLTLGSSAAAIWRMGRFGAAIDNWSTARDPGYPDAMGDPDPDALVIDEVVRGLRGWGLTAASHDVLRVGLDVPDTALPPVCQRAAKALPVLIGMHAKLRTRPGVSFCAVEPVRTATGQPALWRRGFVAHVTIDGREIQQEVEMPAKAVSGKRYPPGTYCNVRFTPSAAHVLLERAEYLTWRAALAHLAQELDGALRGYVPLDTDAPAAPWAAYRMGAAAPGIEEIVSI